jgi:hypothetical protein
MERALRQKEEEKIIDILYIGNNIINNCKIKNKIIYDIRPLNKTRERGSIHFLSENDSKPTSEIQTNVNANTNTNTITNTNANNNTIKGNQKSLKYFGNSHSQFYSIYSDFNKNIPLKIDQDKDKEKEKITKNYELSEKELIDLLKTDKQEENKNNIKIEINPEIKNNKKKLEKIKSFNSINNTKYNTNERKKDKNNNKNNLDYIDLGVLAKELSDNDKKKNNLRLRSFFAKEENVIRGEKIKFLKTCHQVKLVKPLLSQHIFKFKNMNGAKKINVFSPKNIKYHPNHFNLDIIKESNMKKITDTKKNLIGLKSNINKYLTNLVEHLEKEIKYK